MLISCIVLCDTALCDKVPQHNFLYTTECVFIGFLKSLTLESFIA